MLFGGNANNGANAGFSYSNSNNSPSNANANIRSQLCFTIKKTETLPLGKRQQIQKGVGRLYVENSKYEKQIK